MKFITSRDQVKNALERAGQALNAFQIFQRCGAFVDHKECATLLGEMARAKELQSTKLDGVQWTLYGLPGQVFKAPATAAPTARTPADTEAALKTETARLSNAAHAGAKAGEAAAAHLRREAPKAAVTTHTAKPPVDGRKQGRQYRKPDAWLSRLNSAVEAALKSLGEAMGSADLSVETGYSQNYLSNYLHRIPSVVAIGNGNQRVYALTGSDAAKRAEERVVAAASVTKSAREKKRGGAHTISIDERAIEATQLARDAGGKITRAALVSAREISPYTATAWLGRAVEMGLLVRQGNTATTVFMTPERCEQQAADRERVNRATLPEPLAAAANIFEQAAGRAPIPVLDIDAIHKKHDPSLAGRLDIAAETDEVVNLLRGHLSEEEFRGWCRGNWIVHGLRGTTEDLQRQAIYGQALRGVGR